jgi:hypothetical protein
MEPDKGRRPQSALVLAYPAPNYQYACVHSHPVNLSQPRVIGAVRVIEDQITTLRPYNARYTGDHRSIFRKRYAEMITRVSLARRCPDNVDGSLRVTFRDFDATAAVAARTVY